MAATTFSFTGLNGEVFEVSAPAGTSEATARAEFEKQLNSGSLKNVPVGGSLDSLTRAGKDLLAKTASLANLPVDQTTTPADILKMIPASLPVGSLDIKQVTGLLGQAAASAKQAADAITNNGIGKFAIGPEQLESQGLLKPGTYENFFKNNPNADIASILNSPTVWSGKNGVTGLASFLDNPNLQNITQQGILSDGLNKLKSLGAVTGNEDPQVLAGMVQSATKFAPADVAAWAKGLAPPDITAQISNLAKNSQFAVNTVDQLPDVAGFKTEGVINTVNRSGLDSAIKDLLNDPKIPAIKYGPVTRQADPPDPNAPLRQQFQDAVDTWVAALTIMKDDLLNLNDEVIRLAGEVSITQSEWQALSNDFQTVRTNFTTNIVSLGEKAEGIYNSLPADLKTELTALFEFAVKLNNLNASFGRQIKESIAKLQVRIA